MRSLHLSGDDLLDALGDVTATARTSARGEQSTAAGWCFEERLDRFTCEFRDGHAAPLRFMAQVQRVAKQLGYGVESVRTWVRDADVRDGLAGPDAQRVQELEQLTRELEQELRETRRANEILRKAAAYFAQAELDRPSK